MVTVRAADTSESMFQITASQVGPDYLGDNRPVKTIAADKSLIIYLLEMVKVIAEQPIQRGVGWLTRVINRC